MSEQAPEQCLTVCPVSGTKGKVVNLQTLWTLLKSEQQYRITEGRYRFCSAQDCDVVYFAEDGSHVFTRSDLTVRVGVKEKQAPRPICYCFKHTVEEVFEEIQNTGVSTVPEDIRTRINAGECSCEYTNPQGSCCLGVVRAFVEEAMKLCGKAGPLEIEASQPEKAGC